MKRSLILVIVVAFLLLPSQALAFFPDVPVMHEFSPAIDSLAAIGILSGYGNGSFGLYATIKRAQLAKMGVIGYRLHTATLDNPDSPTFRDVAYDGNSYPFDFVEEAAQAGLVLGYGGGTFGPYDDLTRMQLVRIIVRAAGDDLAVPPEGYSSGFADIMPYDEQYVAKAKYNNLISGRTLYTFDPTGKATRGHAAKVLYNALLNSSSPPPVTELGGVREALQEKISEQTWNTFTFYKYRVSGSWAVGVVDSEHVGFAAFAAEKADGRWTVLTLGSDVWEDELRDYGVPEDLIQYLFS